MAALSLSLLGPFTTTLNDQPLHNFKTSKVQALLIYPTVERDYPHRREALFTLLWPGMPEKSARHNLSQTLYALRQILKDPMVDQGKATPWLLVDRQTIQLNPIASIEVDIHQLDRLLEGTRQHGHQRLEDCQTCIDALEAALSLYRGDFLSGFYLEDSNEFEAWAEAVRESYHRKLVELLGTLADIAIQVGDHEQAISYIDRQLSVDDLGERANRQKIEALALSGRRVEAMRQYHEFARRLEDQLGTIPSQETTALYERIRSEKLLISPPKHPEMERIEPTTPRHNLVHQPTPFIGRQEELTRLDGMLCDPDVRLLTIVGPGGMGKTRLAIACAERQLPNRGRSQTYPYKDGVFFVPLAAVDNSEQIPKEIAAAIGVNLNPGGMTSGRVEVVDPKQQLLEFLRPQQMLLVLDNFEQLIPAGEIIIDFLIAAPAVQILVTSRQRLNLQEEQAFPIGGLNFPVDEAIQDPCGYTAIQLFVQSAQRIMPDFELVEGDQVHLTRICQLVDGMPLTLELAATWIDLLSVEEIAVEVQQSIGFLETDLVNIPDRHRSLAAVCNSTWEYLSDQEQSNFARLSVFRGGFTREAAKQVTGASLHSLGTLVKKSLLQFDQTKVRYRFHPYLRRFASEKLAENPKEVFRIRDAHSAYFCDELAGHKDTYESGRPHIAVERIKAEFVNIQTAWDWAVKQVNVERIDQGLDGLCHFFNWNGEYYEGYKILKVVDDHLSNEVSTSTIDFDRKEDDFLFFWVHARVMIWEGYFKGLLDIAKGKRLLDKGKQKIFQLENAGYDVRLDKAVLLYFKAFVIFEVDLQTAKILLEESVSLLQETENYWWLLQCFTSLGHIIFVLGSHQEAKDWLEKGHFIAKKHQIQSKVIGFLITLGHVNRHQGDYGTAIDYYKNALLLSQSNQMHKGVGQAHLEKGHLLLFLGRLNEASADLKQAIMFVEDKLGAQETCIYRGSLSITQWLAGNFHKAEKTILTSIDITNHLTSIRIVYPNVCYIELLALIGQYLVAEEKVKWADEWLNNLDVSTWPFIAGRLSRVLGLIALVENRYLEAIKHIDESIECFQYDDESIAWSQPYLALVHYRLGDRAQSRELLVEALSYEIRMQAYIPMVFTLPVTLLFLAEEDIEFAKQVYAQVRRDRFMSNAQLFHDLVYQHLPEELTSIPVETVEHSDEHREALWETAKLVHAYLADS